MSEIKPICALTEKQIKAFWSKVAIGAPHECWEWTASRKWKGYGQFKNGRAHRFSWFIHTGEWPGELLVCHRCDNPPCVNPSHLFLGTYAVNAQDCVQKGRHNAPPPRRCGEDHPRAKLTAESVRAIHLDRASGCSLAFLANHYGVCEKMIRNILSGENWNEIYLEINGRP